MIDLRTKGLPDCITVNDKSFLINTDFREWIKFGELLKEKDILEGLNFKKLLFVIKDEMSLAFAMFHQYELLQELINFYINKNATPNETSNDSSNETIYDFVLDGEYIVSSFMSQYNIDLTSCDMHWHMFKSLFIGLNDNTIMKQIMTFRSYSSGNKNYEKQCKELKDAWRFKHEDNTVNNELLVEIRNELYNT